MQSKDSDGLQEMAQAELLSTEIKRLVSEYTRSPLKVSKESTEMFLNPQAFRSDTIYQINLQ